MKREKEERGKERNINKKTKRITPLFKLAKSWEHLQGKFTDLAQCQLKSRKGNKILKKNTERMPSKVNMKKV